MSNLLQPRQQRLRQQVSNQEVDDGNDGSGGSDDLDLHVSYRRQTLVVHTDEYELSDYIKARLSQARMLAMQKYQEKWG